MFSWYGGRFFLCFAAQILSAFIESILQACRLRLTLTGNGWKPLERKFQPFCSAVVTKKQVSAFFISGRKTATGLKLEE